MYTLRPAHGGRKQNPWNVCLGAAAVPRWIGFTPCPAEVDQPAPKTQACPYRQQQQQTVIFDNNAKRLK